MASMNAVMTKALLATMALLSLTLAVALLILVFDTHPKGASNAVAVFREMSKLRCETRDFGLRATQRPIFATAAASVGSSDTISFDVVR